MILLIDNYDSFAHNLARYLTRLGLEVRVLRNDVVGPDDVRNMRPSAVVLSPGPCTPIEAGRSLDVVRQCWRELPMLGVCLGHQIIAAAFGARVVRSNRPMHGRTSAISHDGRGLFAAVPNPFTACRYHSLVVDRASLPAELEVTGVTSEGVVMALQHRRFPIVGLQFHPEAILTEHGYLLLANFLKMAGLPVPDPLPSRDEELLPRRETVTELPTNPVTF